MPVFAPLSVSTSSSTPTPTPTNESDRRAPASPRSAQLHRTDQPQRDSRDVSVGGAEANFSLERERAQSTQEVDQTLPVVAEEQRLPEELQARIVAAEKAVMLMLNRGGAGEVLDKTVERYAMLELGMVSGVERLVALEELALEQLAALLGVQITPLSKSVNYEATPRGELVFALDEAPTEDQVNAWEEQYRALDEVVLRLVGATGSAQTFRDGGRVASLERIVTNMALRRTLPNEVLQRVEVGGTQMNSGESRAPKILEVLANYGDIESSEETWLMRNAKLEEVVLEVLAFQPMRRRLAGAGAAE